jgi:signal transduction histidine kinase/CheY-like chemotaxis protein
MAASPNTPATWQGEARYHALFDAIDEGFCVVQVLFDDRGRPFDYVFVEVNPSFERQTGLTNAEGRSMRSLADGHEEHWFHTYGEVARTGKPVRFEAPAEALGRWYDVYAFRVGEPGQKLVAVLFNDVSRRKELERSLDAQNIALREADARKDRFIAILSHELRNPLSPLKVAAELLSHPGVTEKQLRKTADIVRRQVAHMGRLLDDLLDVSRITQGKLTLRRERVKTAELIDAAVESVRPLIERKQHVLEIDLDPASPTLDVDSVRISQVVANLLNNAAKYTDAGGRITLRTKVEGNSLVLQVCDNGIGLSADALSSVFEMFEQQSADSERAEGGLGIGLALVKGLVELHGGSVAAESEGSGRGSRFIVRLPIASVAPDQEADAAPERGESRRRKVLVADDNRDAAESMAMLLDVLGHDVRVAFDGQSALALARIFQPDVAVLDLGMPKMSGYDLARALRREPWAASLCLVAATGWGDLEARASSKEAGFDRHLTKPVDPKDLDEVLRT